MADDVGAVVITVCDQPLLSPKVIQDLYTVFAEQRKGITACDYGGTVGVPALFERRYFSRLLSLADGEGAKRLIAGGGEEVSHVSFPGGAFDLDTPYDYECLVNHAHTIKCRRALIDACPSGGERQADQNFRSLYGTG